MYRKYIKRVLDITMSIILLIVLSPLFIICAVLIFIQDGQTVIFKQQRIGRGGNEFQFYKFRSMPIATPNVESHHVKELKITFFGKFIRRTNLDELPQLWNIVKGDMSIIGPRPPIPSQKELIDLRRENGALNLRPGLTGWAQVNSYDFMTAQKKAEFDGEYASNLTFLMDMRIVLRTFLYLTKRPPTY